MDRISFYDFNGRNESQVHFCMGLSQKSAFCCSLESKAENNIKQNRKLQEPLKDHSWRKQGKGCMEKHAFKMDLLVWFKIFPTKIVFIPPSLQLLKDYPTDANLHNLWNAQTFLRKEACNRGLQMILRKKFIFKESFPTIKSKIFHEILSRQAMSLPQNVSLFTVTFLDFFQICFLFWVFSRYDETF